ncbi:MAG: imidazole glycerol phosphate synthase subunit HisH [Candidatus Omnitrophica bacterium]|nr:imidazole glycerol phosphate synthase subunit HisH [Candidatus Omnitrophota bacterium]
MIALVDYGMGNLRSVANAFEAIGEKPVITHSRAEIESAAGIVLPGVGAFGDGMKNLRRLELIETLNREVLEKKKPYLGICLGMQFLTDESEEHGLHKGFGWIKGRIREIKPADKRYKVPHMGWNELQILKEGGLFQGLPEAPVFYFVHSYHLEPAEPGVITAVCRHGAEVTAAVEKENIVGVQFHPEKSQRVGLQLLKNFVRMVKEHAEKTADTCSHPA